MFVVVGLMNVYGPVFKEDMIGVSSELSYVSMIKIMSKSEASSRIGLTLFLIY